MHQQCALHKKERHLNIVFEVEKEEIFISRFVRVMTEVLPIRFKVS